MHLCLFLFYFVCYLQFIIRTFADSTRETNSSIRTALYQCDSNRTYSNYHTSIAELVFNNAMNSCEKSCCTINKTSETSKTKRKARILSQSFCSPLVLVNSDMCEVTVQSVAGVCLGRLCYYGKCDYFSSLANLTIDHQMQKNTTVFQTFQSSLSYIPWSSAVQSSYTQWKFWITRSGLTMRRMIVIILSVLNIFLTLLTLSIVIKSIKHANLMSGRKAYRYTLL